jgi:hypothetical protein
MISSHFAFYSYIPIDIFILFTDRSKSRFGEDLRAGFTSKTYLARVNGDFGSGLTEIEGWRRDMSSLKEEDSLGWALDDDEEEGIGGGGNGGGGGDGGIAFIVNRVQQGATLKLSQPISCISQVDGVYECPFASQDPSTHTTSSNKQDSSSSSSSSLPTAAATGRKPSALWKEAATLFRKLSFNGKTSVVEVKPLHGRTHQIRLHLQFLGHPIANDPCYGGKLHYGRHISLCGLCWSVFNQFMCICLIFILFLVFFFFFFLLNTFNLKEMCLEVLESQKCFRTCTLKH